MREISDYMSPKAEGGFVKFDFQLGLRGHLIITNFSSCHGISL